VPLAIMLILASDQPRYQPRFMLLALPGFHLLAGRGAAALGGWRPARRLAVPLAIAFIALGARQPLANEWFNPAFWRDDYRGIARTIAATAGPDDAILAMGQSQIDTLNYYFTGQQPRYLLPRTRPLDRDATVRDLEALARRHRRLYVLYYVPYEADPDGVIAGWLQEHAFTEHSQWYGGVELVSYELGGPDGAVRLVNAQFGPQTWLERVAIGPTTVRASDGVRIVMEWRAETPSAPALNVFVHLLDGAGQLVAQHDGRLELRVAAGDVTQQSRYAVLVPSGAAPGVYRLIAGVYDPTTGERLRLPDGGDALPLGEIRVAAQPEGAP